MRIAFLAVDTQWVDPAGSYSSFSYAARKLEASVRSAPDLAHVETRVIDLKSDDPEPFFEAIREMRPTLIAGSMYIWSVPTFFEVARRVKAWDPSIRIVFGGPAARASLVSLAPYRPLLKYVDAIATGEGEETIRMLARDTDGTHLAKIPGLLIPHLLGMRSTDPGERPELDAYPSPYQIGTAPKGHTGFIETFRGCPISCAFCQWGEQRSDRVYSKEYLAAHLQGLVEAKVRNVFFTDAAFNLSARAFRNLMDAEREVNALSKFEVHGHFYPTHVKPEHLEFLAHVGKAQVAIGVQSFDTEVLRKLGRPFDVVRFERVLRDLRGKIPIDVELIYGLPGDNPTSFRETVEKTMELADTVRIFFPMVLPDALLEHTEEYGIRFDPKTFILTECNGWPEKVLRDGWEDTVRLTEGLQNRIVSPTWVGFLTPSAALHAAESGPRGVPFMARDELVSLTQSLGNLANGWSIASARRENDSLLVDLGSPGGAIVLEVTAQREGARSFAKHGGLAYSYRGSVDRTMVGELGRVIEAIHPATTQLLSTAGD